MAFADPLQITYNAVTKDLVRVNQDGYGAVYYLDDGTEKYTMSVKHTIPPRGQPGESHLMRLDVEIFDSDGVYLRTDTAWMVTKTTDAVQSSTQLGYAADALSALMTAANVAKLNAREH